MIYASTITTTANTAKADADKTTLTITKGLIWLIEIDFPPGCCGLQHIQIFDGKYQLAPSTPRESYHGNGITMSFDDLYLKGAAPFELTLVTWNLDELWNHTIQVRVGLASERAFMARYMPSIAWEQFESLMVEAAKGQEVVRQAQLRQMLEEIT